MENRDGLLVKTLATEGDRTAERDAALLMADPRRLPRLPQGAARKFLPPFRTRKSENGNASSAERGFSTSCQGRGGQAIGPCAHEVRQHLTDRRSR